MRPFEGAQAGETWGQLVWCPAGRFEMGFDRVPTVLHGFWIRRYLVTQAEYREVTGENPSGFVGTALPVESVGKGEAEAFARELTRVERQAGRIAQEWEYRLPTDAQWEYACRAGTSTAWSFGDDPALLGEHAWYRDNSGLRTHEVGTKKPNPWGLHDMHGNCLELTRDAWLPRPPGGTDPEVAFADLPPRPDESSAPFALGRGGGWFFPAEGCQSRVRSRLGAHDRGYQLGFRVALVRLPEPRPLRPGELEAVIEAYLAEFRERRYEEAVARMAPDLTVYAPFGFLQGMPRDKSEVVDIYRAMDAEGRRLLIHPERFRITDFGGLALATFVTRGTWWVPPGGTPVARRVTQIWKRVDGRWMVLHGHSSDYRESP